MQGGEGQWGGITGRGMGVVNTVVHRGLGGASSGQRGGDP